MRFPQTGFMKKGCRNRLLLGLVGLFVLTAVPCAADPFSVSGNWNYRENGREDADTLTSFNQSYNLNFAKQLSAMMDLSSSIRYNDSQVSEGQDSSSLNPSATLNLRNDLFSLNFNGSESRTDSEGSVPLINQSWGGNFYSQLEKWPGLRLYYNQSRTQDDQSRHEQNTESTSLGASIDYTLAGFDLLYDFRSSTSENLVADTTTDTLNHYAQLKYSESFFRNRLSVSASQQYSSSETETETPVGADGTYIQPVTIWEGFSAIDDTPLLGTLPSNPLLVDGNQEFSAGVEIAQNLFTEPQNIGIQVDFQLVSRIQVYLSDLVSPTVLGALSWELYQSSDNNLWTQVNQPLTISTTIENRRTKVAIDFPVQVSARYLKLVVRASSFALEPVYVAEVDAGELRKTTASRVLS